LKKPLPEGSGFFYAYGETPLPSDCGALRFAHTPVRAGCCQTFIVNPSVVSLRSTKQLLNRAQTDSCTQDQSAPTIFDSFEPPGRIGLLI
jgi:hypothetical protein